MSTAMMCPSCGGGPVEVVDVRARADNGLRRRRACTACDYRFTTTEQAVGTEEPAQHLQDMSSEALRQEIAIIAGVLTHREVSPHQTASALRRIADRLECKPRLRLATGGG